MKQKMLLAALGAGTMVALGGCAKPAGTAGASPTPDVAVSENAKWSGNIQSVQQSRADVGQSTRDQSYGNFTWIHGASPSLTNFNIVFNYSGQERFLSWAIIAGSCGTPSLPILPISNFPELNVGNGGRSQANGSLPIEFPATGQYHVDVYRSRSQGLETLVGCGNLRLSAR
jgi:hypothetical protein